MSFFSYTRPFAGVLSKPQFQSLLARSSGPHRLSSSAPGSSPRPSANAPHTSRSQFKILPILAIIAVGSGSYILLVKSRTGARQSPSN
ncbi:hypothetical protein N7492_003676 [Penicillium capsulatum]|uniref:Uncharacterized protein n=1 Tax=Penicillium capsulatum TaxID=69766 RepID=A0A9W9IRK3_9EURO|nr:hypothetical protein N7492_003676 [Penicillium capsulatum]KAJ6121743.1 hypothetical protein N7512_004208 [Penicillium capsulatum]